MPELPEVETIRRQLAAELRGKIIKSIDIRLAKLVKSPIVFFKKNILGATIGRVKRRAKILLLSLSNGFTILIHLKMTGQLIYRQKEKLKFGGHPIKNGLKDLPNKYTHVIFNLSDNSKLFFNDLRQFGYLKLVRTSDLEEVFKKDKIGPEPLDKSFTLAVFNKLISVRKTVPIKPLLMDQTFMAGIGNIYAVEACFYAHLNPTRRAGSLKPADISRLYKSLMHILRQAIKKQGTSSNTYVNAYGEPGNYVPLLKVYGRQGELCYKCRKEIKSVKISGRGTAFCPVCQK